MSNATITTPTRPSILIAEDDDATAALLVRVLGGDYDVTHTADGVEALLRLRRAPLPALVVLDVHMPRLDGYAVAKGLRSLPGGRKVPIIFLSARDSTMDVVKGIQHGARHYVTKPFATNDIVAKINKLVRQ